MTTRTIKVLVIEDNKADAEMIRHLLLRASLKETCFAFQIVLAETLTDALTQLAQGDINVVATDLGLSDSHGLETLLRLTTNHPDLPIVVLTGNTAEKQDAVLALQLGAQDYLTKDPLDGLLLSQTLRYAIERKKMDIALRQSRATLERSNCDLEGFASLVSHSLQTPLRSVAGFAHLLAERYQGRLDKEADEYINFIVDGVAKMSDTINNLLEHARAEKKKAD